MHRLDAGYFLWLMKSYAAFFKDDEILILNGVSQHAFQNFLEIMRAQTNNKQTWMHKIFKCNIIKLTTYLFNKAY